MRLIAYGKGLPGLSPGCTHQFTKPCLAMRLTAILLILALQLSARNYAQQVSFTGKEVPIQKVFQEIKQQTGYTFFYKETVLEKAKKVTIDVKNIPLQSALELLFKDQPLSYAIVDKTIVVKEKEKPIVELSESPPATIRGKVVNEKGESVPGVSVSFKGTNFYTTTNERGEFELKDVPSETGVLIFAHVSFKLREVRISTAQENLTVRLENAVNALEDVAVQVSTGYQTIPRERVTGSFATVDKQQYDRRISTDVISRLNGLASGVVFSPNELLGTQINIRSRSTIYANDQPLIVVDNFPYEGDFMNINPNDVESVTILRDASAASIWGVRAGNGVIVITTKNGKLNQPFSMRFNANVTVSAKPDLYADPGFISSTNFIDLEKYLFDQGYYNADINNTTTRVPVSPVVDILARQRAGVITAADANAQINAFRANDIRGELLNYFYQQPVTQQYALSGSGGSDKISYFFSVGYDKNQRPERLRDYSRLTLNLQNTYAVSRKLKLTTGLYFTNSKTNEDAAISQIRTSGSKLMYPYAIFTDNNGNPASYIKDYRAEWVNTAQPKGFLDWSFVPLNELGLINYQTSLNSIRFNAGANYTFFKGLTADIKYQNEQQLTEGSSLSPVESYYTRNLINQYSTLTSGTVSARNIPLGDIKDMSRASISSNNIRGQLNLDKTWGKHAVRVIAGAEARQIDGDRNTNRLYAYNDDILTFQSLNYNTTYTMQPSGSGRISSGIVLRSTTNRFRSYYSNGSYTYLDKYTASLSGRIDQSNFFGVDANQRAVPLWSTGFKWDLDKEGFYKSSFLPHLKLRTSFGYNGNLDKTTAAMTTLAYFSNAPSTGAQYATVTNFPNPALRWEKVGTLNFGVDFGFRNNIVSGSFDYYFKKGDDLMGDEPFAPSTGITTFRGNFAAMKGHGFDLVLKAKVLNRALKWDVSVLLSHAVDKVTKWDADYQIKQVLGDRGYSSFSVNPVVGKPLYSVFSLKWGGLDPVNGDPMGYIADTLSKNYTALLNPQSWDDIIYNGPARPTFFGGMSHAISYKGFMLTVNFNYKFGYYFMRESVSYGSLFANWVMHKDYESRWQNKGDETVTNVPSIVYPVNSNRDAFYNNSSVLVEPGDYIRLQDINLSYDFGTWKKHRPFKSLEAYVYINNVGMIWRANKNGIDPDFRTSYSPPRIIGFGLTSTF